MVCEMGAAVSAARIGRAAASVFKWSGSMAAECCLPDQTLFSRRTIRRLEFCAAAIRLKLIKVWFPPNSCLTGRVRARI